MKNFLNIKKVLVFLMAVNIWNIAGFSYELDMSVDEEIKKKYDADKLKYDVPPFAKNCSINIFFYASNVGQSCSKNNTCVFSQSS